MLVQDHLGRDLGHVVLEPALALEPFAEGAGLEEGQDARGGIYIAGGIAPRILPFLKASPFRERFERKGRFQPYMQAIPTKVILHKQAALLGAARVAFKEAG